MTKDQLKTLIQSLFPHKIANNGEIIIPSLANPRKLKLYVNVDKGVAFDFISSTGYSIKELLHILDINDDIIYEYKQATTQHNISNDTSHLQLIDINDNSALGKRAINYLRSRKVEWAKDIAKICVSGELIFRICFPIHDEKTDKILTYQGRSLFNIEPKYKSLKGVNIRKHIFNYPSSSNLIILCEGIFDALSIHGSCIFGNTMTEEQINLVNKFNTILICIHRDIPGVIGVIKNAIRLHNKNIILYIPAYKDINEDLMHGTIGTVTTFNMQKLMEVYYEESIRSA